MNLPPDVQDALEGLGVVTFDGRMENASHAFPTVWFFTIRDPEFPKCQPTFAIKEFTLTPQSLLTAYARTMQEFAKEFIRL